MDRKKIIIIAIIILVLAGLATAILLLKDSFFLPKNPASTNSNLNEVGVPIPAKGVQFNPALQLSSVNQILTNVAGNFGERYGSYSTDSGSAYLDRVMAMATADFQKELQKEKQAVKPSTSFYGVSSRSFKVNLSEVEESAGTAKALVTLQRTETKTGLADFTFNQDLALTLKKSGDNWLVDSAKWQ